MLKTASRTCLIIGVLVSSVFIVKADEKSGNLEVSCIDLGFKNSFSTIIEKRQMFCGFIDRQTKQAITPHKYLYKPNASTKCQKYSQLMEFNDGMAIVQTADRLMGFVDDTGQEVIAPRFDFVQNFSEGLAAVRIDKKFGFINKKGILIIPAQFERAGDFYQGLAEVVLDKKAGVIDQTGEFVVKPQFSRAIPFTKDVVLVEKGQVAERYFEDKYELSPYNNHVDYARFEPLSNLESDLCVGNEQRKQFLEMYSIKKGWIANTKYTYRQFEAEGRGLIWARTGFEGARYGLLRADGTWQIKPEFSIVQSLQEERAVVVKKTTVGVNEEVLYGVLDAEAHFVIPLSAQYIDPFQSFSNGFLMSNSQNPSSLKGDEPAHESDEKPGDQLGINDDGKTGVGILDPYGNLLGGRYFEDVQRSIINKHVFRVKVKGKWMGLNLAGQIVKDPDDDAVLYQCPSGIKLIRKVNMQNVHTQLLDAHNNPLMPKNFDFSGEQGPLRCDRPTRMRYNEKTHYIAVDGHVIENSSFDDGSDFNDQGAALIRIGSKLGVIDARGQLTVEAHYDNLQDMSTGMQKSIYQASKGKNKFWINNMGTDISEPNPLPPSVAVNRARCSSTAFLLKANVEKGILLWGLEDRTGKEVIEPKYRAIVCPLEGAPNIVFVADDKRRKWCPVTVDRENSWGSLFSRCQNEAYPVTPFFMTQTYMPLSDDPYERSVSWNKAHLEFLAGYRFRDAGIRPPHKLD